MLRREVVRELVRVASQVREEEREEVRVVPLERADRLRRKSVKKEVREGQEISVSMKDSAKPWDCVSCAASMTS